MSNFVRQNYENYFCEIILNLDQWFRTCHLKYILSTALASSLFNGMGIIVQFW